MVRPSIEEEGEREQDRERVRSGSTGDGHAVEDASLKEEGKGGRDGSWGD